MHSQSLQSTLLWSVATLLFIGVPILLWLVPPPLFSSAMVSIQRGDSISLAAEKLTDAGVVYTPEIIILPFLASGGEVVAGTYAFNQSVNAATVFERISSGSFGVPQGRVVIPEGFTNEQIADRLDKALDSETFSRDDFLTEAYPHQGYLYPDTYNFYTDASSEEVISIMRDNFTDKIASVQGEIASFEHSLADVVKMASLVELEASDYEVRRRIAGILWNRINADMPLQVDAAFVPLIGKNTYELTMADLKIESPYNLYTNTGLPPRPIANPGIESIRATVNPIESDDLYYLSDRNGNFYFAETLPKHAENRVYLDVGRD
ncbi:MAG: endolytic transglycosylase MltG [Candidatus Paceibacterota bacterium]